MGKFIIIEGPDFCGKSTQINLYDLNKAHRDQDIFFTREPGSFLPQSDDICEAIRDKILYGDNTPYEEAALFAESRYHHTKDIMRLFNKYPKVNIISDRYIVSSLAYQGYAQKLGKDIIYELNKPALDLLEDTTIHCIKLCLSEEVWEQRRKKRLYFESCDKIEEKDIHYDVMQFYNNSSIFNEYTNKLNMIVYPVNANNSTEIVQRDFMITIDNILYGLN